MKKLILWYGIIIIACAYGVFISSADKVLILFNWMGEKVVSKGVLFFVPAWFLFVGLVLFILEKTMKSSTRNPQQQITTMMLKGLLHSFFAVALIQLAYSQFQVANDSIIHLVMNSAQWLLPIIPVV